MTVVSRWTCGGLLAVALLAAPACKKKPVVGPDTPPVAGGTETTPSTPVDAPSQAPSSADPSKQVAEAVAQLTIGTPEAARSALGMLETASGGDPKNPWIYYNLGVARDQLSDPAGAEAAFREAVSLDDKLGVAWFGLGLLAERRGDAETAIGHYRRGAETDPEDMDLRSALVAALRRTGRLDAAIAEAKTALAFNNKSLQIFNDLGLVYLDRGDLSMARFVYQKALDQVDGAGNSALIRSNYGWALYLDGERIRARGQLEQAHQIDGTYLPALVYLAHFYLDDRNYVDAVPLLEKARVQEPDNPNILLNLGIAYRGVGRHDEARASYERALAVGGGSPDALMNLGILYGDYVKDYPKALEAFRSYVDRGGANAELATGYIAAIEKEQARLERQRQRDEERKRREQERLERERLLREGEQGAAPAPAPSTPSTPPAAPGGGAQPGPWGPQ